MTPARTAQRILLTAGAAGAVLVGGAGPASAAHADVVATADCSGNVAYAVTAWAGLPTAPDSPGASDRSRTNPDLELQVSLDGGEFRPAVQHLRLDADNRFTASGTFSLPEDARPDTLVVRTVARAPWGNGARGVARQSPEVDLSRCHDDPDRRPVWLGGGLVGALAAWLLTRARGVTA